MNDNTELPEDEWRTARKKPVEIEYAGPYTDPAVVETLEGDFEIDDEYIDEHGGYVVICGVEDELYPCALDIFVETYDGHDLMEKSDLSETPQADETRMSGSLGGSAVMPVRFVLYRDEDASGVSGEGIVAYGVAYPDGAVHLQWRNANNPDMETNTNGVAFKPGPDGVAATVEVHGHEGRTRVVWVDPPTGIPGADKTKP